MSTTYAQPGVEVLAFAVGSSSMSGIAPQSWPEEDGENHSIVCRFLIFTDRYPAEMPRCASESDKRDGPSTPIDSNGDDAATQLAWRGVSRDHEGVLSHRSM